MAKPLAQVVDRTPSAHPSPKPSTRSAPTLKQPSISTSSSPSHVAPTMTKTPSGRMRTPRSKLPNEPHGDGDIGGTPPELPRPPDKDKGKLHINNERSHTGSAPSGTLPLPSDHPASAAGTPSRPQPEFKPYSAAVPPVPQKGAPTKSPPETGDNTSPKLPSDRPRGEAHLPSFGQPAPPQEADEKKSHVKSSDQIGRTQSSGKSTFIF